MTYIKPEVVVLGNAVSAIEMVIAKQSTGLIDNVVFLTRRPPAYDLDE